MLLTVVVINAPMVYLKSMSKVRICAAAQPPPPLAPSPPRSHPTPTPTRTHARPSSAS